MGCRAVDDIVRFKGSDLINKGVDGGGELLLTFVGVLCLGNRRYSCGKEKKKKGGVEIGTVLKRIFE